MNDYLVWSDECKIPNIDPYDPQVMKYLKRQKYSSCSRSEEPLTSVQFNKTTKQYVLYFDKNLDTEATKLECCYQAIVRVDDTIDIDKVVGLTKCVNFNKSVEIPNTIDNILVKCKRNQKQIYINGHPMIPERANIRERLEAWKKNNIQHRAPSILMIGIDSISRNNLIRAMPKTAQTLYDNEWFEMSGYNKIGDNTIPNLLAMLTGYNSKTALKLCYPNDAFDDCPIIWKLFQEHGYITAYAEDESEISTFNYFKQGFILAPVDYYLRPFIIAAEKVLPVRIKSTLKFCVGYKHSADYVFDYAIELGIRYKYDPFFGLFWTNTFSHYNLNDCSAMDSKVVQYLEKLYSFGILNESVVIFFSDHGMRYGPIRKTLSGHYEERLPFMFISLPQWFKIKYPEFIKGLRINKNRLTNPYDIHLTLKNLLVLSGRTKTYLPNAKDCVNCQSLFKPVPYNRSCQDISIPYHWCTCIQYHSIEIKSDLVHELAIFIVDYINDYIQNFNNGSISNLCGKIQLYNIYRADVANLTGQSYSNDFEVYRLILQTSPGYAIFEGTIGRELDTKKLKVMESISRLNLYSSDSKCISDRDAKLYCHCNNNFFWRLIYYLYNLIDIFYQ